MYYACICITIYLNIFIKYNYYRGLYNEYVKLAFQMIKIYFYNRSYG